MKKCLLFIFGLLVNHLSFASDLENTSFSHISTEHGLSQKTVQAIFQDKVGFLWFGTQEGLNRYDGREIRVFHHSAHDPKSISHDVIRAIASDVLGNIWVATSDGLNRYNPSDESFERFNVINQDGQVVNRLNTLFLDSSGVLWIGSEDSGFFYIETFKNQLQIKQYNQISYLNSADVRTIFKDSRGRMWIGTDGQGVVLISKKETIHFMPQDSKVGSISHQRVRSIIEDSRGKIWIGTRGGGLNRYDEVSKSFVVFRFNVNDVHSLSHDRVYQVFEDKKRNLWVATDSGISVYQTDKDSFIRIQHKSSQPSSLSHNRVLSIFEDSGGLIWFGTLSGLNQWNPDIAKFSHYRNVSEDKASLNNNTIYAFTENNQGNILVGTFGGGINILDVENNNVSPLMVNGKPASSISRITALMVDRKHNLWIGSISDGIEVLSPSLTPIAHYQNQAEVSSSLSANGVTDIFQDSDGIIWVTTYGGGLNRYIETSQSFEHFRKNDEISNSLSNDNLFHIMEDEDGYLWISSDGGGVSKFDKHTRLFVNFAHSDASSSSLSGNNVVSIFQDSKGRFWIGTQGNGLNRWEPEDRRKGTNNFQHYSQENGLNSSTAYGVLEDKSGYLWISTTKGLNKLNPNNEEIEHYNLADEIHYNEFNQGAFLESKSGRFYFGGTNGISAFLPSQISGNKHIPDIVLTKISSENKTLLFNQPLYDLKQVDFDHNDYLIVFEFAALDFAQPNKNHYQYKLEGFDNEWIEGGPLNRATFTNLPSGSYVFKVKGSNNDELWSKESINLTVNVSPAPWMSWWAFTIYSMAFCLLLILMIRSQAKRLANQEVFRSLVSLKVEEKTSLYNKNTEFLKAQLEQFKHRANVDLGTGLPNEKYLCDLVGVISRWTNHRKSLADESRLCIAFLRLPEINHLTSKVQDWQNETIKQFTHQFRKDSENEGLLVRWSERDIGIVEHFSDSQACTKQLNKYASELAEILEMVTEQNEVLDIKIAYVLTPFEGLNQDFLDSEKLLMLNEHLLHLVDNDPQMTLVGIVKLNQALNSTNFKQILAANRVSELSEVFEFSQS